MIVPRGIHSLRLVIAGFGMPALGMLAAGCGPEALSIPLSGTIIFSDGVTVQTLSLPSAEVRGFLQGDLPEGYQLWPQPLPEGRVLLELRQLAGPGALLVCSADGRILHRLPHALRPAVSPDGRLVAYISGESRLFVRPLWEETADAPPLTESLYGAAAAVWLDPHRLVFAEKSGQIVIAEPESGRRQVFEAKALLPVAALPDGHTVLCTKKGSLALLDTHSGKPRWLGSLGLGRSPGTAAAISRDGKLAAFPRFRALSPREAKDVVVMDLTTGSTRVVLEDTAFTAGFWRPAVSIDSPQGE